MLSSVARRLPLLLVACCLQNLPLDGEAPVNEPGHWAFLPSRDDFNPEALLDLRFLNEKVAGESGFVRTNKDGDFVVGNGKPARFWAVYTNAAHQLPFIAAPLGPQTPADLDHAARFLAKRGVNLVKVGFALPADQGANPDAKITDINEKERDWYWRVVAAMKKQGIYTIIAPYWPAIVPIGKTWGYDSATGPGTSTSGYLYFDPKLQAAFRSWMTQLYTVKNPYTGLTLADDPAVAMIQVQHEDSLFFWTFDSIKGKVREELEQKFGDWAKAKYGSLAQALAAWASDADPADHVESEMLGLADTYHLIQPRHGDGHAKRMDDQTEFIAETMARTNQEMVDFLRHDLGCKQLINVGNWRPADPAHFYDVERWSCTPGDFLAEDRYVDCVHKGENAGWAITKGDTYTNPSVLLDPSKLPVAVKQVKGKPFFVVESSWEMPFSHSTEGPFLISTYESLTGVDAFCWFTMPEDEWSQPQSANGYLPSQMKWSFADPSMLGTFPAAALIYRLGYVKRGEPAVSEVRPQTDLWQARAPLIGEEGGFDPNRDKGDGTTGIKLDAALSPLAYLVGPVEVSYGGDAAQSHVIDLKRYIDDKTKTVTSDTGEVALNYGAGFCTINTPKAQGVAAFFKNHPDFDFEDATIHSENDYGTVTVVAMDNKPLTRSEKILVQVGTECRPTGWKEKPAEVKADGATLAGAEVVDYGKAPWQVISPKVTLLLKSTACRRATVLDMNGNARGDVPTTKSGDGIDLVFPDHAEYVILRP